MPRKIPSESFESRPPMPTPVTRPHGMSTFSVVVLVVVLGMAGVLSVRNFFVKRAVMKKVTTGQVQQAPSAVPSKDAAEIDRLIARVAAHIAVKKDENPTVATIQDVNVLRQQSPEFYKDAQIGDVLLIWSDKAVLYSPARDLILAVVPVSLPPGGAASSTTSTKMGSAADVLRSEGARIEVRNGSTTKGLGKLVASQLQKAGLNVVAIKDVTFDKRAYLNTDVWVMRWTDDAAKNFPETEKALSSFGEVDDPKLVLGGETGVQADYLVIVGGKYQK